MSFRHRPEYPEPVIREARRDQQPKKRGDPLLTVFKLVLAIRNEAGWN